jgi:predicted alpha/beta-hydrolase family hydrolase
MAITIFLGHGAAGDASSMTPHTTGLTRRGIAARAVPERGKLPSRAEKAIDVFRAAIGDGRDAVVGGHSYGGRVASLLAADQPVRGLVLFSYPLHRPGHPEELRTDHWPRINCPVLLLSGESDSFARIELLREAVQLLPHAELVTYPGVGHGLKGSALEDALDRTATFARAL